MMASLAISQPNPMEKKGNLAENWCKWKQNFDIYLTASGIDRKDNSKTCALFLYTIGQYGQDIYNDLDISENEVNSLEDLYSKFENYCNPKTNLNFNRYEFFNTKQEKNQSFDNFLLLLKKKGKNCEFGDLNNSLLMTQIISGISNVSLRARLLRIQELDLNQTIDECRAAEASEAQAEQIAAAGVGKAKTSKKKSANQAPPATSKATPKTSENKKQRKHQSSDKELKPQKEQSQESTTTNKNSGESAPSVRMVHCKFCGKFHVHGKCPAFGSTCRKCQKPNHFANVCTN